MNRDNSDISAKTLKPIRKDDVKIETIKSSKKDNVKIEITKSDDDFNINVKISNLSESRDDNIEKLNSVEKIDVPKCDDIYTKTMNLLIFHCIESDPEQNDPDIIKQFCLLRLLDHKSGPGVALSDEQINKILRILTKEQIQQIHLNVKELGNGVF